MAEISDIRKSTYKHYSDQLTWVFVAPPSAFSNSENNKALVFWNKTTVVIVPYMSQSLSSFNFSTAIHDTWALGLFFATFLSIQLAGLNR